MSTRLFHRNRGVEQLLPRFDGTWTSNEDHFISAEPYATHVNHTRLMASLATYKLEWVSDWNRVLNPWSYLQGFELRTVAAAAYCSNDRTFGAANHMRLITGDGHAVDHVLNLGF